MIIDLNNRELDLVIEALNARASRHESMSRANPQSAGPHDRAASAMRRLAALISQQRVRVPA